VVGLQPGSTDPRASIQRNVFTQATSSIIYSFGTATNLRVSGNYFGYDLNGGVSSFLLPPVSSAIKDVGTLGFLLGTDSDGFNDNLESNWFGCILGNTIDTSSPSAIYHISGNYFGFGQAGSSAGTLPPSPCRSVGRNTLRLSGKAIVGSN